MAACIGCKLGVVQPERADDSIVEIVCNVSKRLSEKAVAVIDAILSA